MMKLGGGQMGGKWVWFAVLNSGDVVDDGKYKNTPVSKF